MKLFSIKKLSVILLICIIFSVTISYRNNIYREDIGVYDIYTLVLLEKRIDNFIEIYNKGEISKDVEEKFVNEIVILSEYLRRSPMLKFMNEPVYKINDFLVYGYGEKEVKSMINLQKELQRITSLLHEESNDNIGVVTYNYFRSENNIKDLKRILDEIR
ncbi:hypothetical protein [Alkaliphilus sp. B6464]|uniref:hypothetical protein n=1 Tax=Alkaliphilus sp. B6464 TaxID=2731219 RepID=UPI001BA9B901|nr:hypothetical protein [Alkaliphilus sp. B6464]QUH21230.1 hypothetical protein HYG84_15965 [Alkaliphilus sp. B6464]